MNIHYRLGIEQKAAACRSEVLALIEGFMDDTGADGETFLPMILALDGVTVPAEVARVRALPAPAPDGLSDDELGELDEMVAGPKHPESQGPLPSDIKHQSPQPIAPPKPAAKPDVASAPTAERTGPLDDAERRAILHYRAKGLSASEIADKLGRSRMGFGLHVKRVVDAAEAEDDAPKPRRLVFDAPASAPLREKALHSMLNAVGYPEPFTPVLDLRLVELITKGFTASGAAAEVGLSTDMAKRRWNALLPEKGIDQQTLLLKALKARAEVAS